MHSVCSRFVCLCMQIHVCGHPIKLDSLPPKDLQAFSSGVVFETQSIFPRCPGKVNSIYFSGGKDETPLEL